MLGVVVASDRATFAAGDHSAIVSFLIWTMFGMITMSGVQAISGEAGGGTLEKMLVGPVPHIFNILAEILSSAFVGLIRYAVVAAGLLAILRIELVVTLVNIVTFALLVVFLVSLALTISSVTIVYRRFLSIDGYVQIALLGLALLATGARGWVENVLSYFPFTNAIHVFASGQQSWGLVIAAAVGTVVSVLFSIALFLVLDEQALKKGSLSQF